MSERKKLSIPALQTKTRRGQPVTMVTCYDYSMAHWVEAAGVDAILVGDSLGMTMLGFDSTLPVTMEDMIRHGRAVRRGASNTFVIVDMPYMSYQVGIEPAVRNAGRLMAETGCDAIKLEGAGPALEAVRAISGAGIPVMGHLGLTPQSAPALGGFRLQGKTAEAAIRIAGDARALESSGAFALLLELVPDQVCRRIAERSSIPVVGLGAGPDADAQLLILHDLLGLYPDFEPRMARRFAALGLALESAVRAYIDEVDRGAFPQPEHSFRMSDDEWSSFDLVGAQGPDARSAERTNLFETEN